MKSDSMSNQLRWVILLLVAAVILPTVCLLWFMNQAVKNERLAVRQKLIDEYQRDIERSFATFEKQVESNIKQTTISFQHDTLPDIFVLMTDHRYTPFDGLIVYDSSGQCLYPTRRQPLEDLPEMNKAETLEFSDNTPEAALEEYKRILAATEDRILKKRCHLAMARIYKKLGNYNDAVKYSVEATETGHGDTGPIAALRADAWLFYTQLMREKKNEGSVGKHSYESAVINLFAKTLNYNTGSGVMLDISSEQRIFLMHKAMQLYEEDKDFFSNTFGNYRFPERVASRKNAEELSLATRDILDRTSGITEMPSASFWSSEEASVYALKLDIDDYTVFRLIDSNNFMNWLCSEMNFSKDIKPRIVNSNGRALYTATSPLKTDPLIRSSISQFLPGWIIELYTNDADVFNTAASKHTSLYIWACILVISLLFFVSLVALRAMGKQIKMNRLKNDFIATVTHELKTPLASMRLLVDTLLEGNCEDQQTATEYLQLVANENKRLTHLIDSFLTFSRMERNKQVFDLASVSPVEIATIAIEAIRPKFDKAGVDFDIDVQKPLPMIQADKDGIVTVLVNLLENAYKYTNGHKQIKLNVYQENGSVCFAVKDNGIGLSPRAQRRIFNRFYQVDNRLSRRAEGCGLGLSIVKFIVDAHKGTIDVESQLDQGSTFIVKLPSLSCRT